MQFSLPLMLLLFGRGGMGGMIKKVLFYSMFGIVGLLIGGGLSVKDLLIIPAIAPMLSGAFGIGAAS